VLTGSSGSKGIIDAFPFAEPLLWLVLILVTVLNFLLKKPRQLPGEALSHRANGLSNSDVFY
jgi:hypothetical protein